MFGNGIGSLNVYIRGTNSGDRKVWSLTGDAGRPLPCIPLGGFIFTGWPQKNFLLLHMDLLYPMFVMFIVVSIL